MLFTLIDANLKHPIEIHSWTINNCHKFSFVLDVIAVMDNVQMPTDLNSLYFPRDFHITIHQLPDEVERHELIYK